MQVASYLFQDGSFIRQQKDKSFKETNVHLVFGFGLKQLLDVPFFNFMKTTFPKAEIALCSTAGEIYGTQVVNDSVSIIAITFEDTELKSSKVCINDYKTSYDAGKDLITKLPQDNLKLAFVLSDGSKVNGSELVKGMNNAKKNEVIITGGLAGDGTNFQETVVGLNESPKSGSIIAIGFYGNKIQCTHGSVGGWETFGLERNVTKSDGNILYEIDHKNALDLYKNYLGRYSDRLPGSALLFPLCIITSKYEQPIVRTILSIDETTKSMTFAGDIPEGSKVRFMKANFDKLIDAASIAANNCLQLKNYQPKVAFLISCVGRKIILGNRIEEEVEAIAEIFGENTILTGFYSYGEISPLKPFTNCELHNQTMTITGIQEIE